MKKTLVAILLIAAICVPAFAVVTYAKDDTTFTVAAKVNLGTNEKGPQVTSIEFIECLQKKQVVRTLSEEVGIKHSFENKNDSGFYINLHYVSNPAVSKDWFIDRLTFDAKFEASRKNGKMEGRALSFSSGLTANKTTEKGDYLTIGGTDWWPSYNLYDNQPQYTGLTFTYSFDQDPTITGLTAGFRIKRNHIFMFEVNNGEGEKNYLVSDANATLSAKATFHLIDKKIKVQDADVNLKVDKIHFGAADVENIIGYKYSYNKGPETNGIYTNLLFGSSTVSFADVSASSKVDAEVSFHIVNGKVKAYINKVELAQPVINASVNGDQAGAAIKLDRVAYYFEPENKPEDNGVFVSLKTNTWYKATEKLEVMMPLTLELHSYLENGLVKTKVSQLVFNNPYDGK